MMIIILIVLLIWLFFGYEYGSKPIYLDNNATQMPNTSTIGTVVKYSKYGNYSSLYTPKLDLYNPINKMFNPDEYEIIYNSGASEGNANVYYSIIQHATYVRKIKPHIISTAYEHNNTITYLENEFKKGTIDLTLIKPVVTQNTIGIDEDQVLQAIKPNTCLISIMQTNNELGDNNIALLNQLRSWIATQGKNIFVHSDITQSFLKIPNVYCDFMCASFHKIGGPFGVGFIAAKKPHSEILREFPLIPGKGARGGTMNIPGIMGSMNAITTYKRVNPELRKYLIQRLQTDFLATIYPDPGKVVIFQGVNPVPGTLLFTFPGPGNNIALQKYLKTRGILIGIGAACSLGVPSRAIASFCDPSLLQKIVRVSFNHNNSKSDVDKLITWLREFLTSSSGSGG